MKRKVILGLLLAASALPAMAQEQPPPLQQQLDSTTASMTKMVYGLAEAVAAYAKRTEDAEKRLAAAQKELADYKAANSAPKSEPAK